MTKTLKDLQRHSKAVKDHFFDKDASASLKTVSIQGIYRAPYSELTEGYVVTVNSYSEGGTHAYLYRFEATPDALQWFPIGRHDSLQDAEAFLAAMNVRKA